MADFDWVRVATGLTHTALAKSFFGCELFQALNHSAVNQYDRVVLRRWMRGTQTVEDGFALQDIANKIMEAEK